MGKGQKHVTRTTYLATVHKGLKVVRHDPSFVVSEPTSNEALFQDEVFATIYIEALGITEGSLDAKEKSRETSTGCIGQS